MRTKVFIDEQKKITDNWLDGGLSMWSKQLILMKICSSILIGLGIVALYGGCCLLKQARDAQSWPHTKGQMIASLLTINHLPKFVDPRADPARWYGTDVQYKYTVGKETYISHRLSFQNGDTRNPVEALRVMNKYRRIHNVNVYYDPKNPNEAVLEPWTVGQIYMRLAAGALSLIFGLVIFYYQSLEFHPKGEGHIYQGNIYQNQGRLEDALYEFNQAIKVSPNFALGYRSRAGLYLQQENWDYAIADYNRALVNNANDALVYFAMAKAYIGKKEYDKALAHMYLAMGKGFEVNPDILEDIKKKIG
ncbi:MAG: DUF3592 domain-containing protein [Candidatus Omnitrophota bacterium]